MSAVRHCGSTLRVNLPLIDTLWRVRGSLPLDTAAPASEIFARLESLFQVAGTNYEIENDALTFHKKDPLSQDKMSIYKSGTLNVRHEGEGRSLAWDMHSPALMFCFCLPFFFLGVAWLLEESRTPSFVFTGIFAFLYVVGRILEPRLFRAELRRRIAGEVNGDMGAPAHS